MSKRNRLTFLSLSILGISTVISCAQNTIKKEEIREIDTKLNIQKENQYLHKSKNDDSLLLNDNTNNKDSFPVVESALVENNNIGKIELKLELNSILNINKIFKKWNKRVKQTLRKKKELEAHKKKKKIIVATTTTLSSLLLASGIIGTGVYLFKYNRELLHKIDAFLVDLGLKAFLKIKKIDADFMDAFKNLIFYLFKENDSDDKKLINFFANRVKEVIFKKREIKDILPKEDIEKWIKEFGENENKDNYPKNNNPVSYLLKILESESGEKILMEFVKLLDIASKKKDELKNIKGLDKVDELLEQPNNTNGVLSTISSFLSKFNAVKNGVEFIIEHGKEYLESNKKGLINILEKLIKTLRKIINKNKNQFSNLSVLYNFVYNWIKLLFKGREFIVSIPNLWGLGNLFNSGFDLLLGKERRTFKITDIITPETIKKWIEDNTNDKMG